MEKQARLETRDALAIPAVIAACHMRKTFRVYISIVFAPSLKPLPSGTACSVDTNDDSCYLMIKRKGNYKGLPPQYDH